MSKNHQIFIAISPDSQKIVTFSPVIGAFELELYNTDDLSSKRISTPGSVVNDNDKHLCWSIAISNCVGDGKDERFIALSCFDIMYGDDEKGLESGDNYPDSQTWVFSTTDENEIYTSSIGGVIRFLDSDDRSLKNKTVIIIIDVSGIYKETMNNIKRKRFFSRSPKIEQFELPQQLSIRLSRNHCQNSLELLHTSIIKNHFMVHSFKDRQQIIEMYSLITGDLEMLFKRHESSVAPSIIHGSPIFAISQNEKILAFCRGTPSITLYFMENGLEITTKRLEGQREIYKIIAINFIDEDSKLLIVLDEKEYQQVEILKRQIFIVWDLFTTFENSIRQIDYSETQRPLKMDVSHRLENSHGKIFAVTDNGEIFSVLDHPDVALIRNPSAKEMTETDITTSGTVYLDSTESTQLIISGNTIQVWKYHNTIENQDKRDRELEYIWAQKKAIVVQELKIGEREFVLKISVPSTKCSTPPKSLMIHWPNNVNVLEGACRALYVFGVNKNIAAGHQIKYLIECTQRLIRKYTSKYSIFRLTSIRHPIMKYLIKNYQESLIKHILDKKINRKNSNLYIPRLYKWAEDNNISITERSKSDLHHAILCIQKRGDSTVILKYLIDYYADNTKEYNNVGWMFTVSKAIPLLYDKNLNEFVQYLFKKPCFGITEAYTPPLHINPYDRKKGNNAAVLYSLAGKPCLASKIRNTLWFFLKNPSTRIEASHNDRKVYIVPLPDFTVYPNPKDLEDNNENNSKYFWLLFKPFQIFFWPRIKVNNNTKKMSPFLRVIHEEKGYEIYQIPTIMAVLDFKWSAAHSKIMLAVLLFVFIYTGSYLIVTEIVQLKREGWYRYMNIYNMFDLGSMLLPLVIIIAMVLDYCGKIILQNSVFIPVVAFTALVMWLEVLFLLRYFEVPGRFVYIIINILNTIWPFFAFMLSVILAFGHAMFMLQNYDKNQHLLHLRHYDYYSRFASSVEAVFSWTNGRWNSYSADVMSILGSIILVLIFQNMLIAFMNGAFDKEYKKSRTAARRYRTERIEALEKPSSEKGNPRYIYYIPDPDMIDNWLKEIKENEEQKLRLMGENLAELTDLTDFDYGDDEDQEILDNSSYSKKDDRDEYSSKKDKQNESSSSTESITNTTEYCDKITFTDEEIFVLKVISKRNRKEIGIRSTNHQRVSENNTKNNESSSEVPLANYE
ncbi:hypothetical protein Glove_139g319 [Diversispora epigaea]|uniref:Ion transport domain-containing protein n=1 Tax=Diversispora epigaea TaxID=1348612 RepID=A0A397J4I4_9GLOM|nr:hypothetical protein Glove_139g319 [Diversispora epigaea]